MKKDDLPPLTPNTHTGHKPIFGDQYAYMEEHFIEAANNILREFIYPVFHEHARQLMHEGHPCVLQHLVDQHLSSMDNDPVGLKLFVAPKGTDRHEFEQKIHNRDFVHPAYFAVIASPVSKTIKLEYYKADRTGETVNYYEKRPNDFDVNRVKLGLLQFSELLP